MTVTVRITLTRDEVEEYRECWKECNPGDISDEEIRQKFIDQVIADKNDYIYDANFKVEILESMPKLMKEIMQTL